MPDRREILHAVAADWGEDSSATRITGCLLDRLKADAIGSVTANMVIRICPDFSARKIREALMYLASERIGCFELVFAVYDEDGLLCELVAHDVRNHLAHGQAVIHPVTGDAIESTDELLVFYRGTERLREVLRGTD